jgi:hypothetical protein
MRCQPELIRAIIAADERGNMSFENLALVREITNVRTFDVAEVPRKLEITISGGRQIFGPSVGGTANRLVITAGTIRFGYDNDNRLEDNTNEFSDDIEVDKDRDGSNPRLAVRTVELNLDHLVGHSEHSNDEFRASASFAALGDGGLCMDDRFIVAVDNAEVQLTAPKIETIDGRHVVLPRDLWFFSDVSAQGGDSPILPGPRVDHSILNRLGYHSAILLQRPAGSGSG